AEAVRLILRTTREERQLLLDRVARATDEELAVGSDERWGVGQIAVHLLIVERGSLVISLRLAQSAEGGPTGQPRPAASGVSRERTAPSRRPRSSPRKRTSRIRRSTSTPTRTSRASGPSRPETSPGGSLSARSSSGRPPTRSGSPAATSTSPRTASTDTCRRA